MVSYAETRPPVIWTGKIKCGRESLFICLDGWWTGNFFFFNSYLSRSPEFRTT